MNETMRVLLIDDSPYDRELIKRTLQRDFPTAVYVEVLHEEALTEALRELDYSVVCTDYYLKWTTGIEVLHQIRARSAEMPVLMVTDTGSEEIAAEAMRTGLNDYVLKSHLTRLPVAIKECLARLQLQREHRALQAQMQQAQKLESLGLLVSGIAHDFNNLLSGIMGFAQRGMAQAQAREEALYTYFEHIQARAEHGAQMTRQLLAFARGAPMEPQRVEVNTQIAGLVDLLRTLLGAAIQVDFHPDAAVQAISADPTQLEQAIMNLCLNARDAMPEGGGLEISTEQVEIKPGQQHRFPLLLPGAYVLVRVRDTGVGMDEASQARLFEPFFTTKEKGQGTGLGLAVVYGIVKQHGGAIRVQSQPGEGTTFSLYFPAVERAAEPAEPEAPREVLQGRGGGKTVLLVEDDADIRTVLADVLQDDGYTVLVAGNGEEGLRALEQHAASIALVIADVMMPKMQGSAFQEQVQRHQAGTELLVISGYQEAELKRRNLLTPTSAFLQKPFDLDVFIARVREIVNRSGSQAS